MCGGACGGDGSSGGWWQEYPESEKQEKGREPVRVEVRGGVE